MKKIIILISFLFLLTGCFDYQEINNLAFISAIGIDYQDNEYIVTLETLNDKIDKDSMKITTYTETGKDKSFAKAMEKASDKLSNQSNFSHAKLIIVSKSIASDKLGNIADFFLRSTYTRENIYIISSLDHSPEELLNNTNEENPIASTAIVELLKSNNYSSNSTVLKTFDKVIEEILTFGIDTAFSNISLDNDNFMVDGIVAFNDYKFATKLDNEEATLYNIYNQEFKRPVFSKMYDNKSFAIAIATGKVEVKIENDKLQLDGSLTGKIMDNEPTFDIKDLKTLNNINDDFTKILNQKFTELIIKLQQNKSDILGISNNFYKKEREKNTELWQVLKINANIDFKINKKGLIYQVPNEE